MDTDADEHGEFDSSPYESPHLLRQLDNVTTLEAGEKHVFKCLFTGVPLPEVEWSIGDQLLEVTR